MLRLFSLRFIVYFFLLSNISCKKKIIKCEDGPFSKGFIIGFDPCTAISNNEKGYVIKFENNPDTVVIYFTLPNNISIPSSLYSDYVNNFLFPNGFRDIYVIHAKYHEGKASEQKIIFCNGLVYLGDFVRATKGKQSILDCVRAY